MYSEKTDELFDAQLHEWELAKLNYRQLENVINRVIDFGAFRVFVQFNPGRIRSSSAKVDTKSIEARPCFLCEKNRPPEQRGVSFKDKLTILVNPFPIFKRHLTIPSILHIDQRIRNNFDTMLVLAEALPSFVIFYNGPQCGASAPDHFHFQAGNRGFMPLGKDFQNRDFTTLLSSEEGMEIWHWKDYQRGIITLKGDHRKKLINTFYNFLERLTRVQPDRPEPMLNILVDHADKYWTIHIIPRKKHRPSQFFTEGRGQLMVSPAAVDLGGVLITPREEDFEKITRADIEDIFAQVCFNENETTYLLKDIV